MFPLLLVAWPIFSALIGLVVYGLFVLASTRPTDAKYLFRISMFGYMAASMFIAFIPLAISSNYMYEKVLKDRYLEYLTFQEYRHGYDNEAALKGMSKVLLIVSIPLFVLLHDWNIKVYEDRISFDPLLSVSSKVYTHSSISKIELDTSHGWKYKVFFKDGNELQLNNFLTADISNGQLTVFLSSKTGLKIDTVCNVPKRSN